LIGSSPDGLRWVWLGTSLAARWTPAASAVAFAACRTMCATDMCHRPCARTRARRTTECEETKRWGWWWVRSFPEESLPMKRDRWHHNTTTPHLLGTGLAREAPRRKLPLSKSHKSRLARCHIECAKMQCSQRVESIVSTASRWCIGPYSLVQNWMQLNVFLLNSNTSYVQYERPVSSFTKCFAAMKIDNGKVRW